MERLEGKERVEVVCIDLSPAHRALAKRHFPNARIVADRFHVVRLVNQQFLAAWKAVDPAGAANRGLLSLMRRHAWNMRSTEQAARLVAYLEGSPGLREIHLFKQQLCGLLLHRSSNRKKCRGLGRSLLRAVRTLLDCGIAPLVSLGRTLDAWKEHVDAMWRFTKNNGVTEGFHNKMENIKRQAHGFRNFENYRLRVRGVVLQSRIGKGAPTNDREPKTLVDREGLEPSTR